MECRRVPVPGGVAIVCGRFPKAKPCSACGAPSTRLCDFPLKGPRAGKTCDKPLCDRCAAAFGDEVDYCPPHARLAAAAATAPPAPLACQDAEVLACETCGGRAPRCNRCLDDLEEQLAGVVSVRGEIWGESVKKKRPGEPWPSYDAGGKVADMARAKVRDVAGEDEKLLERLARRCAAAAARAYSGT